MVSATMVAGVGAALALLGEWLHARRCRRIAMLAFAPTGRPRSWVRAVPALRIVAVAALAWGLAVLAALPSAGASGTGTGGGGPRHLVMLLDVSPSMTIADAGPGGSQTRADRAREVLRSALERLGHPRLRFTIVAFYSAARPVVTDTSDREVVANILHDLPLEYAFLTGKTRLYDGLASAATVAKDWAPGSASLLVLSDGDTLPSERPPVLPSAYHGAVVVGVGDTMRPTSISGHSSRQEAEELRRLAGLIGGRYHDANRQHIPTTLLAGLGVAATEVARTGLAAWALAAALAGAAVIALLPLALMHAGAPRTGAVAATHSGAGHA